MNRAKRWTAFLTAVLLLMMPAAGLASSPDKTEVIYAKMKTDGGIEEVIAVNGFERAGKEILDYGRYTNIINLTNTDPIEQTGDQVRIQTDDMPFYYQGTVLTPELPWQVDIHYALDGKEGSIEEFAGKSGRFSMRIDVVPNPLAVREFADTFLLQIMVNLPGDRFEAVEAPEGTIASQGETSLITFTVMPGKEGHFELQANGNQIELGAVQMAGLPFSMGFDLPDLSDYTGDLVELQDAISQLTSGVREYTDGVGSIYDATGSLQKGAQGLAGGANRLSGGLSDLTDGMDAYQSGLNRYVSELEQGLGSMEIPDFDTGGLSALTDGSRRLHEGMQQLQTGMQHLHPEAEFGRGLDEVTQGARDLSAGMQQLMYGTDGQPGLLEASDSIHNALKQISDALTTGMPELDEEGMENMTLGLKELIGGMQEFLGGLDAAVRDLDPGELEALIQSLYGLRSSLRESVDTLRNPGVDLSQVDADTNPEAYALYAVMLQEADRIEARLFAIDEAIAAIEETGDLLNHITTMQRATLQMISGARQVLGELSDFDLNTLMQDLTKLIDGMVTLSTQYAAFNEGLHTGLTEISRGLDNPEGEPPGLVQGLEQLQSGYAAMTLPILAGMTELVPGAGQLVAGMGQMADMLGAMAGDLDISGDLNALLAGSMQLRDGHRSITGGMQELDAGLADYASGVDAYAAGMLRFQEGMYALRGGGTALSYGMQTLESETAGMDEQMKDRMDEIMDSFLPEDAPDRSFLSPKNQGPVRVQFLYMTHPVHMPESDTEEASEKAEKSVWERILDLFR